MKIKKYNGLSTIYKDSGKYTFKNLYTEKQKLYYIYFSNIDKINTLDWHTTNTNKSNLLHFYMSYLKIPIGTGEVYDKYINKFIWDKFEIIDVNPILKAQFDLFIYYRNSIIIDLYKSNIVDKNYYINQYSPFNTNTNKLNESIDINGLNYYFKTKQLPISITNKIEEPVFEQNQVNGKITIYKDYTFE